MNVDLTQCRIAGVDEPVRRVWRNDDDAACLHLALFISNRDRGLAFDGECDLDVGMFM